MPSERRQVNFEKMLVLRARAGRLGESSDDEDSVELGNESRNLEGLLIIGQKSASS